MEGLGLLGYREEAKVHTDQGEQRHQLLLESMQSDGAKRRAVNALAQCNPNPRCSVLVHFAFSCCYTVVQNINMLGKITCDQCDLQDNIIP